VLASRTRPAIGTAVAVDVAGTCDAPSEAAARGGTEEHEEIGAVAAGERTSTRPWFSPTKS